MDETTFQKYAFIPVCSKAEIDRIFNVQNASDYLLKIRAETLIDHMRLFRVYRNYKIMDEKNWSLEKSFDTSHYDGFLDNIDASERNRCHPITYGNIFSNDPNGRIFQTEFGPIITISDSLRFFIKFMNLALLDFEEEVPEYVCMNSMRIALRVMLRTEALDFLMDPRGKVPQGIWESVHLSIPYQMRFIVGHEFSHYLLGHISDSDVVDRPIFLALLPCQEEYRLVTVYNQSQDQELEADIHSLVLPTTDPSEQLRVVEATLLWFGCLDIFEVVSEAINPSIPWHYRTHPSARDRFETVLTRVPTPLGLDIEHWKGFLSTVEFYKHLLLDDVSRNIERYEFYGSVYLDEPDSEWRGPKLQDRIDYY